VCSSTYTNILAYIVGIRITGKRIEWDRDPEIGKETEHLVDQMRPYYPDVKAENDPTWPPPRGKPVKITIFCDADHSSNIADRRSITGIIVMLNGTPYIWKSKRQTSVEASTFGAEICAARIAVEEAIGTINTLKSLGLPIDGPAEIYIDNHAVVQNTTIPGSSLRKKHLSIAYHIIREAQVADLVRIFHIRSEDNPSDILTKSTPCPVFTGHNSHLMAHALRGEEEEE